MEAVHSLTQPDQEALERIIAAALQEDIGTGDVTSRLLIPAGQKAEIQFVAREKMVACGTFIVAKVYAKLDVSLEVKTVAMEGQSLQKGDVLATVSGDARAILTGERIVLNLMQRMCGVATLTRAYVEAVKGTKAVIIDTRKTIPGLRIVDKYAVRAGGGQNHRMRLDDMVLIKDNHIALAGNIAKAVDKVRAGSKLPVVVECDTLEQVTEALAAKPDRILLDNMDLSALRKAVALVSGHVPLEASGRVSLDTVRGIADTGVDYISIGKLTHSAPAVDIGADIILRT